MRFDYIVPMNDLIDRPELANSPFNFSIESFDFSIGLGVFYPGNNMSDIMLFEELLECMLSMFPVPGRNELGTMVG